MYIELLPPGYTASDNPRTIDLHAESLGALIEACHTDSYDPIRKHSPNPTKTYEIAVFTSQGNQTLVGYGEVCYKQVSGGLHANFYTLTVAEEHRRRGIARFIIAKRFEHVRGQTGVVSAAVPALSRQNNLESYYESLGFAPDPTEKNALVWHRPKIISTGLSTPAQ